RVTPLFRPDVEQRGRPRLQVRGVARQQQRGPGAVRDGHLHVGGAEHMSAVPALEVTGHRASVAMRGRRAATTFFLSSLLGLAIGIVALFLGSIPLGYRSLPVL